MFLQQLSIQRFRNIQHAELNFRSRITVLVGKNGQGKTSILEAAYLLSQNRSFRTNRNSEVQSKIVGGETNVAGVFETDIGTKTLAYSFSGGRRQVFLNGNRVSSAEDFFGTVKILDFTPDDLFIVRGSPGERRGFLDKILSVSDREYLAALVRYMKALKQRNALLAEEEREELLEPWERTLVGEGMTISKKRAEFITQLAATAQKIYESLLERNATEEISLSYESDFLSSENPETLFLQSRRNDLRYRTTTVGCHRDDLKIHFDTGFGLRPAKEIASQGQTRSAALSLKLAGVEYLRSHGLSGNPIILLDDVESELDLSRRQKLVEYLLSLESQILIATTDRNALPWIQDHAAAFYTVEQGRISFNESSVICSIESSAESRSGDHKPSQNLPSRSGEDKKDGEPLSSYECIKL